MIDRTYSETEASITIPYELIPLPNKGDIVIALNRMGETVCKGKVLKINSNKNYNKTNLVTISIPKKYSDEVRFFKLEK